LVKIATHFVNPLDLFVWMGGQMSKTAGAPLGMRLQIILDAATETKILLFAHVQSSLAQVDLL